MSFSQDDPEFSPLEDRIRAANAMRSVRIGYAIGRMLLDAQRVLGAVARVVKGFFTIPRGDGVAMLKRFAAHR